LISSGPTPLGNMSCFTSFSDTQIAWDWDWRD